MAAERPGGQLMSDSGGLEYSSSHIADPGCKPKEEATGFPGRWDVTHETHMKSVTTQSSCPVQLESEMGKITGAADWGQ